jgi:hypothetical protein
MVRMKLFAGLSALAARRVIIPGAVTGVGNPLDDLAPKAGIVVSHLLRALANTMYVKLTQGGGTLPTSG